MCICTTGTKDDGLRSSVDVCLCSVRYRFVVCLCSRFIRVGQYVNQAKRTCAMLFIICGDLKTERKFSMSNFKVI